jgi:hypothetical protein
LHARAPLLVGDELDDVVLWQALELAAGGRRAAVAAFRSLPAQLAGPRPGEVRH